MHIYSRIFIYTLTALFLSYSSCSDPKEQEPIPPTQPEIPEEVPETPQEPNKSYLLHGNVEKGPFISGSEVNIQELDSTLTPTGRIFKTNIKNHEGYFDLGELNLASPYARLSASGYYYNEVKGELSTGPIVLNALVDLSDKKSVYLNLLTHIKQDRVAFFIKEEKLTFSEANKKAQEELFSIFSLQQYADKEASEFSIAAGTKEAGALITLSSILLEGQTDAEFSESLAIFTDLFTQSGTLPDELKQSIKEVSRELDFDFIVLALTERYKSLGKEIEVKNLRQFVDWDDNGVAGDERPEWDTEDVLRFPQDTIFIPQEGGEFYLNIISNLPLTFENPEDGSVTVTPESIVFWESGEMSIRKSLSTEPKQLVLEVTPASHRMMKPLEITVYSTFGKKSASITIVQQGDQTADYIISPQGLSLISSIMDSMQSAYSYFHTMEAFYTNCWNAPTGSGYWPEFDKHTLNPSNQQNYSAFSFGFNSLSRLRTLRKINTKDKFSHLLCNNLEALLYTDMLSFWGNLPDVTQLSDPFKCIPFENQKTLLSKFESGLLELIPLLPERAGHPVTSIPDYFITSADVARFNLARIHMVKEEINEAFGLLQQIIESKHYQINSTRQAALTEASTEILFSLSVDNNNYNVFSALIEKNAYFAVMPYTEVVLLAAECAYKLGYTDYARMYLHQVTDVRNTQYDANASFIDQLQIVWQQELKGSNSYFGFLKRNNLATKLLNIESYRQLFPIPLQEITINSCAVQNPGYSKK